MQHSVVLQPGLFLALTFQPASRKSGFCQLCRNGNVLSFMAAVTQLQEFQEARLRTCQSSTQLQYSRKRRSMFGYYKIPNNQVLWLRREYISLQVRALQEALEENKTLKTKLLEWKGGGNECVIGVQGSECYEDRNCGQQRTLEARLNPAMQTLEST